MAKRFKKGDRLVWSDSTYKSAGPGIWHGVVLDVDINTYYIEWKNPYPLVGPTPHDDFSIVNGFIRLHKQPLAVILKAFLDTKEKHD